jgi:hypothetical protein
VSRAAFRSPLFTMPLDAMKGRGLRSS